METYRVKWTPVAIYDLHEIVSYISNSSKTIAKQKYLEIKTKSQELITLPTKGRIVPELKINNITKYRELIINPWRVIYRVELETVFVLAVIDGRRNLEDILLSRNLR